MDEWARPVFRDRQGPHEAGKSVKPASGRSAAVGRIDLAASREALTSRGSPHGEPHLISCSACAVDQLILLTADATIALISSASYGSIAVMSFLRAKSTMMTSALSSLASATNCAKCN